MQLTIASQSIGHFLSKHSIHVATVFITNFTTNFALHTNSGLAYPSIFLLSKKVFRLFLSSYRLHDLLAHLKSFAACIGGGLHSSAAAAGCK
jgi:hypothetical protein